jgi:hypothetical protein
MVGLAQQKAEDIKVSGNFKNQSMFLVFAILETDARIKFEYKEEDIQDLKVTALFKKMPLDIAMGIILNNTDLAFEYKSPRTVIIIENKDKKKYEAAASKPKNFDFTLKGIIKDKDSGETLPFANVIVKGTNKGASTNVDGYFTMFNVPSDTSVLVIQYIGYRTKYFRLHPEMTKNNLVIEISNTANQLSEIIVISEAEEQTMNASTGVSQISVSPMQLNYLPSFGEKDIFRSLQLLPGISGSNESSSGLYVRGGTPDQNLILFDGFTVYHVDHLFGFFSAFNANAVKDIQLYKGGFEAKYGGRLSSVVELTGKDGNTEKLNMGFGASLLSVNAFVESPFAKGKGSFFVAGRRSFQSNFYNNLFTSFTEASQDASGTTQPTGGGRFGQQETQPNTYFYDLNAKVTYRPSDKDILSLSFYNGQDDLDNSRNTDASALGGRPGGNTNVNFERTNTDLTKWGNWGASSKWSRRWNENFYTKSNLSYSQYFSERNRSDKTVVTRNDTTFTNNNGSYEYNNLQDVTLKIDNEWKLLPNNQMEFGFQSTYNDIEYEYTQNDTLSILSRLDQGMTNSVYLQDRHTFNNKLIIKGGIRASHYSVTNKFYVEPRASFTYLANDKIKVKGAWGRYNQMATRIVREDIQQGSRDFWLLANGDNIPVGYAEHFIAGTSYETPTYLFDVEGYYKNLDGLTEYTTRFIPEGFGRDRTLEYEELFYTGTGTAKGIEFLAQKKKGKFTGWVSYTLGEVLYDFEAFGSEPFHAVQDQTHEAKIVASYKWRNWNFGATFIYATGRPYTAPTGYYQVELLDNTLADFYEISDKNAVRLPDYHRLDFSVTNDFKLGNSNASIGASIFNVYNKRNVWYKEYEVIEGEMIETDVTLLNFTPSLFFNWQLR